MPSAPSLAGKPVSHGIAIAPVYIYHPFIPEISQAELPASEIPAAKSAYKALRTAAEAELTAIQQRLATDDPEKAKIFTAHLDILFDESIDEEIDTVMDDGYPVDRAIDAVYSQFMRVFSKNKNPVIRERADDLRDVRNRLLRIHNRVPERNLANLSRPVVVAAHDLMPSDTATLDRRNVMAILTEIGGETSHSAIIAKSYEIPAILGIPDLLDVLTDGQEVVVDAIAGTVHLDVTDELRREYEAKRQAYAETAAVLKAFRASEPVMADGTRIAVQLNIGTASPAELENHAYVDGIGLFRTEFLYMGRDTLPDEQEQYEVYKKVLLTFGDKPVTLRTMDIGGDKQLPCLGLPKEDNAFLGNRALRLCLSKPDVFHTQLRAALRAAVHGNLHIMFPMVGSLDDIYAAKAAVESARRSLADEGVAHGDIALGIMIEIPSIAMMAEEVAAIVDFASIGTNDLTQYLLAVDRMNPSVASYYQSFHPALFRMIHRVAQAFLRAGKELCVCGELGGDPLAGPLLVGLGLRSLSMGASGIGQCKKSIRALNIERLEAMAQTALAQRTAGELEAYLQEALHDVI